MSHSTNNHDSSSLLRACIQIPERYRLLSQTVGSAIGVRVRDCWYSGSCSDPNSFSLNPRTHQACPSLLVVLSFQAVRKQPLYLTEPHQLQRSQGENMQGGLSAFSRFHPERGSRLRHGHVGSLGVTLREGVGILFFDPGFACLWAWYKLCSWVDGRSTDNVLILGNGLTAN